MRFRSNASEFIASLPVSLCKSHFAHIKTNEFAIPNYTYPAIIPNSIDTISIMNDYGSWGFFLYHLFPFVYSAEHKKLNGKVENRRKSLELLDRLQLSNREANPPYTYMVHLLHLPRPFPAHLILIKPRNYFKESTFRCRDEIQSWSYPGHLYDNICKHNSRIARNKRWILCVGLML